MLIVDVLAVLPLPFLASLFGGNAELDAVRVLKLVRLLRLGRLMRKARIMVEVLVVAGDESNTHQQPNTHTYTYRWSK